MNRWDYLNMFKQPSTWAGVAVLLSFFGIHVAPEAVVNAGVGVAGTLAVLVNEVGGGK